MTKIRALEQACLFWANDHGNGEFPKDLNQVVGTRGMTAEKLAKLVASPDKPDAKSPAIVYRAPRPGKDFQTEIIFYESVEQRRDGNVTVGVMDGHAEVMTQEQFEKQFK
jgi:hypothetical protein